LTFDQVGGRFNAHAQHQSEAVLGTTCPSSWVEISQADESDL